MTHWRIAADLGDVIVLIRDPATTKDEAEALLRCPDCERLFVTPQALGRHRVTHRKGATP